MPEPFGGAWTKEKLMVISLYLDAYTTALKNQPFDLVYLDAFAGEGYWRPKSSEEVYDGSPRIALQVDDKPFDKIVLIEKDPADCESLRALLKDFPGRNIEIRNGDANEEVARFCSGMQRNERAVVFLDPFATEVRWGTVEKLARTKKVDCLLLFPLGAVARMMQRNGEPNSELKGQLDSIFGSREPWESLYDQSPQLNLWANPAPERTGGSEAVSRVFRTRLESIFASVTSKALRNSKNSPLFELFFAASNPKGAPIAIRIANHILKRWGD